MDLKDKVMNEAMKLAGHPAVAPILQDERFMKLFMNALSVPGRLSDLTDEQRDNFIRAMRIARQEEVADLKRTVRSLEDELGRLRREVADLKAQAVDDG